MERFFNSNKFIGIDIFPFLQKNIIPATNFLVLIIEKLIME